MKQKLVLAWRILVAAGMVGVLIIAGILASVYYREYLQDRHRNHSCTYTSDYSDAYVYERYYDGETVRLKDAATGEYLTPKLSYIYDKAVADTLTVFFQNGKRGFLNIYTGKIEIPAQYDKAWIFSEGLGAVIKGNKLGFINKKGETVIPCQFAWKNSFGQNKEFLFKGGYCAVSDASGKQGIIDKNGEWVISAQYDDIAAPFNGYRIVYRDNKCGLLDNSLRSVLPLEYDKITLADEGIIISKGSSQKMLAYDMKTVLQPFVYDSLGDICYNSGKTNDSGEDIYVLSDYKVFYINGKCGLIDKNGHVTVNALYEDITAINNDLFSCKIAPAEDFYITINGKGEVIK